MKVPHNTLSILLSLISTTYRVVACPYLHAQGQEHQEPMNDMRVLSHDVISAQRHHQNVQRGLIQVGFFRLIDSTTSQVLADPLVDGAIIPIPAAADISVTVEAVVSDPGVQSVVFDNGRKESFAPYSRCGDNSGIFSKCWDLGAGPNTVSALVVSSKDGTIGPEATVTFTLQFGGDPIPTPTTAPVAPPTPAPKPAPTKVPITAPTAGPVRAKTSAPVASVTSIPVPKPTSAPISTPIAPVSAPTSTPVTEPTPVTTLEPTSVPVDAPTLAPTSSPTSTPVRVLTVAPVQAPTLNPTTAPKNARANWFVNLGRSTTFTDENGQVWQPDIFQTGIAVDECPGFSGTPASELFCSRRTWRSSTTGILELLVPSSTYEITLFFSETTANPGERIMDVVLEGQTLFALDIAAQIGGSFGAFQLRFNGPIFDGALSIELRSVRGDPVLSAIRIVDSNAPSTPGPISVPAPISPPPVPVPSPTSPRPTRAPSPTLEERIAAIPAAKFAISRIMTGTLAAQLLRLSFHDCVGGCDGCVNLNNPENAGLREPIQALAGISTRFSNVLTRADVWVLAGLAAAESSLPQGANLQFNTEFLGRPVCAEDDPFGGPIRELPGPHLTADQLIEFFLKNFGFSNRDTAAIMGAHTMGRARRQNSGFDGVAGWTLTPDVLDNGFYRALLTSPLERAFVQERQRDNGQILWRRNTNGVPLFMLNADMALVVDLEGSINLVAGGTVSCSLNRCPRSPLRNHADRYFNSQNAWLLDFREALIKMTSKGCETGSCLSLR